MNVISRYTLMVKREFREWHFNPFIMILSEKLVGFSVISCEIANIT